MVGGQLELAATGGPNQQSSLHLFLIAFKSILASE